MRHFSRLFIIAICFICFKPSIAQANEYISQFKSQISVNQDTSITIHETISYFTDSPKHGIYRYLPFRYLRQGIVVSAPIKEIKVSLADGSPVPYTTTKESGNLMLKIGDPDSTFQGERVYQISYVVNRALTLDNQKYPQLYWDITGEGWQIPIRSSLAIIDSPLEIISQANCYSGPVGGHDSLCQLQKTSDHTVTITYPETINYGDNLTALLIFPESNQFHFPSDTTQLIYLLIDNLYLLILFLPLLLFSLLWFRFGRDYESVSGNIFNLDPQQPQRLIPIFHSKRLPFIYEPLSQLTPAEAGSLIDEKVDNSDLVADIVDLARKQYLKITAIPKKGLLFSSTDYSFERLNLVDPKPLPSHQQQLLNGLFPGSVTSTNLSELKGTFYLTMNQARATIMDQLTKNHYYTRHPQLSRGLAIFMAIVLNLIAFMISLQYLEFLNQTAVYIAFIVQGVLSFIFAYQMVQKTVVGHNLTLQASGLKNLIAKGKWREEIKEKHLFIEEVLPFAIAFGVVNRLAKDMAALNMKPPAYTQSLQLNHGLFSSAMISDFTAKASSSLGYNPSSSSWSSGGGSSGGSSGGGGGGGGGGSW